MNSLRLEVVGSTCPAAWRLVLMAISTLVNLYVLPSVLRYDGTTGMFIDEFVAPEAAGSRGQKT